MANRPGILAFVLKTKTDDNALLHNKIRELETELVATKQRVAELEADMPSSRELVEWSNRMRRKTVEELIEMLPSDSALRCDMRQRFLKDTQAPEVKA